LSYGHDQRERFRTAVSAASSFWLIPSQAVSWPGYCPRPSAKHRIALDYYQDNTKKSSLSKPAGRKMAYLPHISRFFFITGAAWERERKKYAGRS